MPSVHTLVSHWIPKPERSRAASFVTGCCYAGSMIANSVSPIMMGSIGYQWVFYIFGGVGFIWAIVWFFLAASTPELHTTIHPSEKKYIEEGMENPTDIGSRKPPLPIMIKNIVTSKAAWAVIINHFCSSFGPYIIMTWLPTFFEESFHPTDLQLAFLLLLPYLCQTAIGISAGFLADLLIVKYKISTTVIRKIFQGFGLLLPALCYVLLAVVPNMSEIATCILMISTVGTGALVLAGVYSNHLDIAPNYAGVVLGVANTFGAGAGIVGPMIVGAILQQTGSWQWPFLTISFVNCLGALVFFVLATAQPVLL